MLTTEPSVDIFNETADKLRKSVLHVSTNFSYPSKLTFEVKVKRWIQEWQVSQIHTIKLRVNGNPIRRGIFNGKLFHVIF